MRLIRSCFIIVFILTSFLLAQNQEKHPGALPHPDYTQIYAQFRNLKEVPLAAAKVNNLTLERDRGKIILQNGMLFLLQPINGDSVAVVFKGQGRFELEPPNPVERGQLKRFLNTEYLNQSFSSCFMLFYDHTLQELKSRLTFGPVTDNSTEDDVDNALKYMGDEDKDYLDPKFMKHALEHRPDGYFYLHYFEDESEPYMFEINPVKFEPVRLMHRASGGFLHTESEVICQFKSSNPVFNANILSEDYLRARMFKMDITINDDLDFYAKVQMQIKAIRGHQQWIKLLLYRFMEMDSIKNSAGENLEFYKPEEKAELWVRMDHILSAEEPFELNLYYHSEKLLERDMDAWIYFRDPAFWYPRTGHREKSLFDLTFHYPENRTLVSVGEQLSIETKDEITTAHWKPQYPIRNASFNIGLFKVLKVKEKDLPEITILKSKGGHIFGRHGAEKEISADMINSLRLFKSLFGEIPVDHFYISETPYLHGLAFPGLIHLSWATYQYADARGYHEIFRAHEVAHQWWGIAVDFKTYHDQWLSEGFAEYSGLWYMQMFYKDNDKFFDILNKYKESILTNRVYLGGKDQEAGPIWLGYRTASSKTRGDYGLIVYKKGAWVLHMLRIMMLNLNTMNEDKFIDMLHDYYNTFRGRKASTANFQWIVEKHMDESMDWFFKQWVYGTAIPKFEYAYTVEKAAGNSYLAKFRVNIKNVKEDFKMPLPIEFRLDPKGLLRFRQGFRKKFKGKVNFSAEGSLRVREMLNGLKNEFTVKLPAKPKSITLNYLDGILGEFEEIDK